MLRSVGLERGGRNITMVRRVKITILTAVALAGISATLMAQAAKQTAGKAGASAPDFSGVWGDPQRSAAMEIGRAHV